MNHSPTSPAGLSSVAVVKLISLLGQNHNTTGAMLHCFCVEFRESVVLLSTIEPTDITSQQSRIFGSISGRIRKLSGFQKSHHVPDSCNTAAQAFVRKIGHEDVKSTTDQLYADIRQLFGYKRREFAYSCEDGFGIIKTPDFDVQLRVDQSSSDPKNYELTTEIVALHTDAIAADARFHSCFTHHCDTLVVESASNIDIDDKVDALEDIPEIADCLDYEPDGRSFELKLPQLDLHIVVTETQIHFRLLTLRNLGKLIDHSQQAFDILAKADFGLKLR
ncbi:MAG: hypothetical protein ACON4O_03145 [Lentimonas sp.]